MIFELGSKVEFVDLKHKELTPTFGQVIGLMVRGGRVKYELDLGENAKVHVDAAYVRVDGFDNWERDIKYIDDLRTQIVELSVTANEKIDGLRDVLLGDIDFPEFKEFV